MTEKMILKEEKGERSNLEADGDGRPVGLNIAYIGGGSRGWAHGLMKDLATCPHMTGEIRLYDIDHDMAVCNARFGNWLQDHPDAVSRWHYRVVASLKEALRDVDFVFLSIQPGHIELMQVDLEEPMKMGIYQPVGDTVGPGGCIRALRAIRDYKVFGEAIGEYAPKAWCLNFTNPMTICTRALYAAFPAVKAYGCCHEVFGTQGFLARLFHEKTGEDKPAREEVHVNVLGINHFTWVDKADCRGRDLMVMVREYIARDGVLRPYTKEEVVNGDNWFTGKHQVALDLCRRFGLLGAAGDRHLAEFVPWYLTSENACFRWGFRLTPFSYRIKRFKEAPKQFEQTLASGEYPELNGTGEEYLNQMLALVGKACFRTNVNLPNMGQMDGIPRGAVVETNALFFRDSVEPIASGGLPDNVNFLVLRHVLNQESLIKAVFSGDRDLAFQAFLNDALVGRLSMDQAWDLFNSMVEKTGFQFG